MTGGVLGPSASCLSAFTYPLHLFWDGVSSLIDFHMQFSLTYLLELTQA
ncbi:hypothetical protein E2C01_054183 [Portunus trituberculatus]|uniref:Uncharacterized protein n=1 Tax=Portunus trituberculatus TaxID=210409 RepID=A0A5B7GS28_PORTR|nr:hypothetical protein [Portunus trituberculatus]